MSFADRPSFDSLAIARRILELNAEVDRLVKNEDYFKAADIRDERESLMQQLIERGSATVAQNLNRLRRTGPSRAPVLTRLRETQSTVDADLLRVFQNGAMPPRWIMRGYQGSCIATLEKHLNTTALDSSWLRDDQLFLPLFICVHLCPSVSICGNTSSPRMNTDEHG